MNRENITHEMVGVFFEAIENSSVSILRNIIGKNIRVRLNMKPEILAIETDSLVFSTRASNCLNRAKARTVGDIVKLIESGNFYKMKCAGVKTRSEITGVLLALDYYSLNEAEKREFCRSLIELNYADAESAA